MLRNDDILNVRGAIGNKFHVWWVVAWMMPLKVPLRGGACTPQGMERVCGGMVCMVSVAAVMEVMVVAIVVEDHLVVVE